MKTIYIPKGETVHYESLATENLVVKGCLDVDRGVKAKHISGNGVITAGEISADAIRADDVEAAVVTCEKLIAKRVTASEVFASQSAAVSCCLSAGYVRAGRLTVGLSDIDDLRAEEVINLPVKKRGLLGTLLASALRSLWLSLTAVTQTGAVVDADFKPEPEPPEAPQSEHAEPAESGREQPGVDPAVKAEIVKAVQEIMEQKQHGADADGDFELQRIIAQFKLAREGGYTLRLIPGAPEENAPVFNFEHQEIVRPAA